LTLIESPLTTEAEGEKMTTVLVNHRVADYDAWKPHFDRAMEAEWTKDVRSYQVWRDQDDPSHVFVANTFDSREAAEAMAAARDTARRATSAGALARLGSPSNRPDLLLAAGVGTRSGGSI
jgi:hypothetical protein